MNRGLDYGELGHFTLVFVSQNLTPCYAIIMGDIYIYIYIYVCIKIYIYIYV